MISFSEALSMVIASSTRAMPTETVPLVLAAGRILATSIVSSQNIPAAPNSAMDGYAIHAEDVTSATVDAPTPLRVIGESAAGLPFSGVVGRGQAVRIMTGGVLPEGANGVIEVEATTEADTTVLVRRAIRLWESVRAAGEDIQEGAEAIPAGKRLTAADVGVLASLGVVNVPVRVKPIVGLLATGNELVEPFRTPSLGQIRNSSLPALYALCNSFGAEPIDLGIASDDREDLLEKIEQGLRYDLLVTTGGVSAGEYDFVQHALPDVGVAIQFHNVNIRPGKPVMFGVYDVAGQRTLVFGLPGNPVSTVITFQQFVLPAMRTMLGITEQPMKMTARLTSPINKTDSKRHFIRGFFSTDETGQLVVATTGTQSSGALSSVSKANCLIVLSENSGFQKPGDIVTIELL
ncbi:MAG: molybdopterin molybdotransferase MoeA [Armatimonadetes bacterium]|nr:molybdopterin molybdotransferase MoeA [Armatimonadota bacterium]